MGKKNRSVTDYPTIGDQNLRVGKSTIQSAGRGIFARRDFTEGELVTVCPVILIPRGRESTLASKTIIGNYVFGFGKDDRGPDALCLGLGGLFNNSMDPDVYCEQGPKKELSLYFYAARDIREGQEVFLNYNAEW